MPVEKRELYRSSNGDRWFLAREPETGRLFVRHEANIPSGGQVTDIDIGAFLGEGRQHPEHQALLHMIGTLVEGDRQRTGRSRSESERRARDSQQQARRVGMGPGAVATRPKTERRPAPRSLSGPRAKKAI